MLAAALRRVLPLSGVFLAAACAASEADPASDGADSLASAIALPEGATGDAPRPGIALSVVAQEARDGDLVLRVKTPGDVYGDAVV
ncbi:MAG TPA: hypothetical protein PKE51_14190, partial [Gemmatimonadaceae bacterium]|nr:hypothetical protein [Gemmatimonadaceae bacterium]